MHEPSRRQPPGPVRTRRQAGSAAEPPPLDQLTAMLAMLQAAEHPPWPDAAATMAEERRAPDLARLAGAQGEALAAAILQETERLFAATE